MNLDFVSIFVSSLIFPSKFLSMYQYGQIKSADFFPQNAKKMKSAENK